MEAVWKNGAVAMSTAGELGRVAAALLLTAAAMSTSGGQAPLMIFAGAAIKPPLEEAISVYESKTGTGVDAVMGGSGYVLSQMKLARQGDLYFPGSSDFMEKAKRDSVVFPATEREVVYLVSAINVQRANPRRIHALADLAQPGIRVAIANPQTVCVGTYAVEIIESALTPADRAALRRNIVNYTESCEKTATAVSLKAVDAVIGWSVFAHWDSVRIATIPLKESEIQRIGYVPVAVSTFTRDRQRAQQFIDFVLSEEGKAIFRKYKYFMTPQEAAAYVGAEKPVGGEYRLPESWIPR